ncbi:LysM domain-containing protein [Xylariomycetidae sp. FL0641]|nr:LysM domain-containing protein [Xylariomycetidae sp. FL0641]
MPFFSLPCLLLTASVLPLAAAQVFVGPNRTEVSVPVSLYPPDNLTNSCNSTFTTEVKCDVNLPLVAFGGYFPTSDDLTLMCTSECLQSLEAARELQNDACSADVMTSSGMLYPITATVDAILWTYNYTCRRDSKTGDFCAPTFDAWASGNASDQACSDCVLGTYQLQLAYDLGYDDELASSFASLTSSCSATGYPVASPPPMTINVTSASSSTTSLPTATPSCASTYTVKSEDDCHSISMDERVSTNLMLYLNELEAGCTNFADPGAELCMPHTCDIYTVQKNDTCWGIAESFNNTFTISQLVSWNVDISNGCDNLELLQGTQICVSFPGDTPNVTVSAPAATDTVAPIPSNVVAGTNTRCSKYYQTRGGDNCALIGQTFGISLADFYFLNPEINTTDCNNLYLEYSYCVQAVGDIATYPGYAGNPTNPCFGGTTLPPSSCFAETYATTDPWTFPPVVTTAAPGNMSTTSWSSYVPSTILTSSPVSHSIKPTPKPYQDGMVSGCTDFRYISGELAPGWRVLEPLLLDTLTDIAANDSCVDIATLWGLSFDTLLSWNPDLKEDCSGLLEGTYICVVRGKSGPSSTTTTDTATSTHTTTTTPPTSTGGGSTPPGPTQSGIPSDCDEWTTQEDGVYCQDMADKAGISLECLYQLNPALITSEGECQGLWAGYSYCVGTASHECT